MEEDEVPQDRRTWFAIPCLLRDDGFRSFSTGFADSSSGFLSSKDVSPFGKAQVFRQISSSYCVGVRCIAQKLWMAGLEVSWSPAQTERSIKEFIDGSCHARAHVWQFEGQYDLCSFEKLVKLVLEDFGLHEVHIGDLVFSGTNLSTSTKPMCYIDNETAIFGVGLDIKPFFSQVAYLFAADFFLTKAKIVSCQDSSDCEKTEDCLLDISGIKLELSEESAAFKTLDKVQQHMKLHLEIFRFRQKEVRYRETQQDAVRKLKETQLHKQMVGQRVKRKHCFDITFGLFAAVLAPFAIVTSAFGMNNEDTPIYVAWGWLLGGSAFISLFIFGCFIFLFWHFTRQVRLIQTKEETLIDERVTRAANKFSFLKRTQPKFWLGEFDEMANSEKTSLFPQNSRSVSIELPRK
jgi:hypothetical protein